MPILGDQQCHEKDCTLLAHYICYSDKAKQPLFCASCIYKPTCGKVFCEVHAHQKLITYYTGSKHHRRLVEYHIRICKHCEKKLDKQTKKAGRVGCFICIAVFSIFLIIGGIIFGVNFWGMSKISSSDYSTPKTTYTAPTSTYKPPTSTYTAPTSTYKPPTSTYTAPTQVTAVASSSCGKATYYYNEA